MFIKDGAQIDPTSWIVYSVDGTNLPETMLQTQPINATPAQLALMGITVVPDIAPVKTLDEIKTDLRNAVAAERFAREQYGVKWRGLIAQTDRESRANYVGMVVAVQAGLRVENSVYKFVQGAVPVANADVIDLARTVADYVQFLYTREDQINKQIDALADVPAAMAFTWVF